MCIAIYKANEMVLKDHVIANSYHNNSDGAGFAAWTPEDGLVVKKGFFTLAEFLEAYEPYSGAGITALLHFRIATHGPINADNCHPFVVELKDGYKVAIVHNGVISGMGTYDQKVKSDTAHFVESVLKPAIEIEPKIWLNKAYQHSIENLIGWSKLAFLDSEGNSAIYNQDAGIWDSNCWWSNGSYQYVWRSRRNYCGWGDDDAYSSYLTGGTGGTSYQGDNKSSTGDTQGILPRGISPTIIESGKTWTWEDWLAAKDKVVIELQEGGIPVDANTFPFGQEDTLQEAKELAEIATAIAERESQEYAAGQTGAPQLSLIPFHGSTETLSRVIIPVEGASHSDMCFCTLCSEHRAVYPLSRDVPHTIICECASCIKNKYTGTDLTTRG